MEKWLRDESPAAQGQGPELTQAPAVPGCHTSGRQASGVRIIERPCLKGLRWRLIGDRHHVLLLPSKNRIVHTYTHIHIQWAHTTHTLKK